jgi:hypothetical protein|tara:strand:- start:123675 stop:124313 length:639 start_codon:yes stop_codon:yes gene_type:complete
MYEFKGNPQEDGWNPVTGEQLKGFLSQVDPIDGKFKTNEGTTQVHWRSLPFYERVALVRIQDPAWTPGDLVAYYLTDQGALYRLNGLSAPIHDVNTKAPVKISEENVIDYLKFFCFFVRGEEGPFLIAEDAHNPYIPEEMDDNTRSVIEGTVRPATYEGTNENGHMLCDAVVFYSNALFIANFAVEPTGMIQMLDDDPIAADLPISVEAPIS